MSSYYILATILNAFHPNLVLDIARSIAGPEVTYAFVMDASMSELDIVAYVYPERRLKLSVDLTEAPSHLIQRILDICGDRDIPMRDTLLRRQIPGQPAGLGVYWPRWNSFLIALAGSVSSFFYIYFFPDTQISLLEWIKNTVGLNTVHSCVHFAVGLHSFQTVTAWYLMRRVAQCNFSFKQTMIWTVCVQFLGIGSMLKLLPIVYNSKFVKEEEDLLLTAAERRRSQGGFDSEL
ncbi:hypothetical protein EDD11_006407 [Mortierella claussenii]|nr:hypothetical protein EDD11_006407 [Mortierella claussenii]